jgi:hypothetical protein
LSQHFCDEGEMMLRARLAVFGICGLLSLVTSPLAKGQDPTAELTKRIDPAAVYLNPLCVNQWVGLTANKSINGRLVAFDDTGEVLPRRAVEVSLVQKGKTISQAITDADGEFQFKDIAAGTYNFVAQSDYCFATFGIHVLPAGSGSPTSFAACAATLPATDAKELMKDNWVPSEAAVPRFFERDPLVDKRVVANTPRVHLQNGDLLGQVSRPGLPISEQDLTGNVAHIFKAGRSIAAAPIGRDGKFRIASLEAGIYDLVVVGEDGNAVIGFEAVGPKPIASNQSADVARLVSFQDIANTLNIELAAPTVIGQEAEVVPSPPVQDTAMDAGFGQPLMGGGFSVPGGGFPGGAGFGGGAGGGGGGIAGGGLGGLLGIAGLAVGVAAISGNDNFNPIQATIITP